MSTRSPHPGDEELIVRYLLGEAGEDESRRVEEWYFRDGDALEEFETAEDELIDAYVAGELVPERRARFESLFLHTEGRRRRVENAHALRATLAHPARVRAHTTPADSVAHMRPGSAHMRPDAARRRIPLWLPLAACILICLAAALFYFIPRGAKPRGPEVAGGQNRNVPAGNANAVQGDPQRPSTTLPAPPETAHAETPETTAGPTPAPSPPSARRPTVAALTLSAGLTRGGVGPSASVVVTADTKLLRLTAPLEAHGYTAYSAVIRDAGGRVVWSRDRVAARPADGNSLTLFVPAAPLRADDYTLSLLGLPVVGMPETAGEYQFRVVRK
jgi:hypothetical protein